MTLKNGSRRCKLGETAQKPNNDPKEVIAYKTPFEIYIARKCNAFRESKSQDEILPSAGRVRPTKNDRNRRSWQAKKATSRCDKRMQRT